MPNQGQHTFSDYVMTAAAVQSEYEPDEVPRLRARDRVRVRVRVRARARVRVGLGFA